LQIFKARVREAVGFRAREVLFILRAASNNALEWDEATAVESGAGQIEAKSVT
jgi:hypothetical protein